MGRVAWPPPAPVPVDGHLPMTTRGYHHDPPPPPGPHSTTHGTQARHWEVVGQARLQPRTPVSVAAKSESDGSPEGDDRHHRWSRSRYPVSPGSAGETPAEREERRLAEAAVPVGWPAEEPWAVPRNPKMPAPKPMLAEEAALAAQTVAPAAQPA